MKAEQLDPHLVQAMVDGLQAWRHNTPGPEGTPAARKQAKIGGDGLLDGWLSLEWRSQQEAYWAQWKRRKSSK